MTTHEHETQVLDSLTRAVALAMERKRRLGHYAVVWRGGRPVCIGPDAPMPADTERGESASRQADTGGAEAGHASPAPAGEHAAVRSQDLTGMLNHNGPPLSTEDLCRPIE